MDKILLQAILLGLVALFANMDFFFGGIMTSRPLVTGVLVGLIMGDVKTGMIVGATLELAFMGSFSIGQPYHQIQFLEQF